jgi:hypothetical protein
MREELNLFKIQDFAVSKKLFSSGHVFLRANEPANGANGREQKKLDFPIRAYSHYSRARPLFLRRLRAMSPRIGRMDANKEAGFSCPRYSRAKTTR